MRHLVKTSHANLVNLQAASGIYADQQVVYHAYYWAGSMMTATMEAGNALTNPKKCCSQKARGVESRYSELSTKHNSIVHSGVISGK